MNCGKYRWQVTIGSVRLHQQCWLFIFLQIPAKIEPSDVAMVSVSTLVTTVMGLKIALMAVMKVDVVNHSLVG